MKKARQKRRKKAPQVYDSMLKEFMQQQIPDLIPVLLPGAVYQETLDIERIRPTLRSDRVYKILYQGQLHIVDVEFQAGDDEKMASRLLAYHAILYHEYQMPVISLVIYLFRSQMIESPWREMSGDEALITFRFFVLPLFLLDAERFVREHITCMYPLLPAMQGVDHELIGKAMDELAEICHDQRVLSERFLWMEVLLHRTDTIDALEKVEIQRKINMYEFLLESNPRIKRIRLEAKEEGKVEGKVEGERKGEVKGEVKAMRQSLIDVVEIRFPALTELATQRAKEMSNLEELRQLMRQATAAPDEATVRRILGGEAS